VPSQNQMLVILALTTQKNPQTGRFEFQPLQISPHAQQNLRRHIPIRRGKKKGEQPLESPFIRAMDARKMLGSRSLVERCERAGWFEPVKRGKRMTLYLRKDIEAAVARIGWGEMP
jgi:hypothetical protein